MGWIQDNKEKKKRGTQVRTIDLSCEGFQLLCQTFGPEPIPTGEPVDFFLSKEDM